jgi:prevent-host-death family protein
MQERVVSATEFKAKCLAFLDEMDRRGGRITITKRGRPVAVVGPVKRTPFKSSKGSWVGRGKIVGDIVSPGPSLWECLRRD